MKLNLINSSKVLSTAECCFFVYAPIFPFLFLPSFFAEDGQKRGAILLKSEKDLVGNLKQRSANQAHGPNLPHWLLL